MTRRWVKKELRKNPVRDIVVKVVKYFRSNKNNFYITVGAVVVMLLFVFVIVRNKIEDNKKASLIYAQAQSDFYRFNYKAAVQKLETIEKQFSAASVVDQALYLKAQVFYKKGELERASLMLSDALEKYSKSKIKSEMIVMLGSVYESLKQFDKAESVYSRIATNSYLHPEALSGQARIKQLTGKQAEAINLYKQIQSHYPETYWGDNAKEMLAFLGVRPQIKPENVPDLNLR